MAVEFGGKNERPMYEERYGSVVLRSLTQLLKTNHKN